MTIHAHDAQLVALLHAGGPELLFIAEHIPFEVGESFRHLPLDTRRY